MTPSRDEWVYYMRKVGPNKRGRPASIEQCPREWGYLLGVMCSDGCIEEYTQHSNGYDTHVISIRLHVRDRELPERFAASIDAVTNRRPRVSTILVRRAGRKDAEFYMVRYRDRLLGLRLLELGIFDTYNWRVPDVVLTGSRDLQVGFINGLFDGDGSVRDRTNAKTAEPPKIELGSASEQGLRELSQLLMSFDIPSHIYYRPSREGVPFWNLIITRKTAVASYWQQIGITLTRKADRFQNAMQAYLNRVQFQWRRIAL